MTVSRWSRVRADGTLGERKAQESPSPWTLRRGDRNDRNAFYIHAADCTIVAVVDSDEPDAHLITAAPGLRDACLAARHQLIAVLGLTTGEHRQLVERAITKIEVELEASKGRTRRRDQDTDVDRPERPAGWVS